MSHGGIFGSKGSLVIAVPVGGAHGQGGGLQGCGESWSSECQRADTWKAAGWSMRGSVDQIGLGPVRATAAAQIGATRAVNSAEGVGWSGGSGCGRR